MSKNSSSSRRSVLAAVAAILAAAIGAPVAGFAEDLNMSQPKTSTGERLAYLHGFPNFLTSSKPQLTSLERANEWLGSPPLTAEGLRGKVVLVNIWTYTCINWLRQDGRGGRPGI